MEPRTRTLTSPAQANYLQHVGKLKAHIHEVDTRVTTISSDLDNGLFSKTGDVSSLQTILKETETLMSTYNHLFTTLTTYLETTRSQDSLSYLPEVRSSAQIAEAKCQNIISRLNQTIMNIVTKSRDTSVNSDKSSSKRTSFASHRSSSDSSRKSKKDLELQQTKTKIKLQTARKEAEILRRKANLDAELLVLKAEQELQEADAEIDALEGLSEDSESKSSLTEEKRRRTKRFVESQEELNPIPFTPNPNEGEPQYPNHDNIAQGHPLAPTPPIHQEVPMIPTPAPYAPTPDVPVHVGSNQVSDIQSFATFSKFLLKKELSLNRLYNFNDQPETYGMWKNTISTVVKDLELDHNEQLDLLIKYLGPDSKSQTISIRLANCDNPQMGLHRVWQRLDERFSSPELVDASIKKRLAKFPKISNREYQKLYDLSDLVSEVESLKDSPKYRLLFSYFDSSAGVNPIVAKLPFGIQDKWTSRADDYKQKYAVAYPPFSFFAKFIRDMARVKNDPSFCYEVQSDSKANQSVLNKINSKSHFKPYQVIANKMETQTEEESPPPKYCPFHDSRLHHLDFCRAFRYLSIAERDNFLIKKNICIRCCDAKHKAENCKVKIFCNICKSADHPTPKHINENSVDVHKSPLKVQEGEEKVVGVALSNIETEVNNCCTELCKNEKGGKSCAKTYLAYVYNQCNPEQKALCYIMVDGQSNRCLANSQVFDYFQDNSPDAPYILRSCGGVVNSSGRLGLNYVVEALDGSKVFQIPSLVECNEIPFDPEEVPTPEVAQLYPHMHDISDCIPPLEPCVKTILLIGRDVPSAHHVLEQRLGKENTPFAQRSYLGWSIIGNVCLGGAHLPDNITVSKTSLLQNGRPSLLEPCRNAFIVDDRSLDPIFRCTKDDEKPGLSIEDNLFLDIMKKGFTQTSKGNWSAPLPFRVGRPKLENNHYVALKRTLSCIRSLSKDSKKKQHMLQFMHDIFQNEHAEIAPQVSPGQEVWYLPLFGIYHPKKPDKVRVVFDSSAKFKNNSLNDVLLSGPDMTNNLLGILLRFRSEAVAIAADIESMFYNFLVTDNHRDYLRFYWFENNDPELPLIEYRMKVHVFGNTPSPAVATYGLRKSVENADTDVQSFISRNFYVDDGITSLPDPQSAIDLLTRTRSALLSGGNIKLHKIASNRQEVLDAFPPDSLAKPMSGVDIVPNSEFLQSSLGLIWNTSQDRITYRYAEANKPFTRRGILSTVNSLFDPIGFLAPVTIQGKLFLREIMSLGCDWDDPLPDSLLDRWKNWKESLLNLNNIEFPRMYCAISLSHATHVEVHTFCDASLEAISAVSYLRVFEDDHVSSSLVLGKAKVAPLHANTIVRLELCAAVLAVELYEFVSDHLIASPDSIQFYSDSQVILGYIKNERRRFLVYVANRVARIRRATLPQQWFYIPSGLNPADIATRRDQQVSSLKSSPWVHGPPIFPDNVSNSEDYQIDDSDVEVKPIVEVNKVQMETKTEGTKHPVMERFKKFSSWKSLLRTITLLRHLVFSFQNKNKECKGWHFCNTHKTVNALRDTENYIIRELQKECFKSELDTLSKGMNLPSSNPIAALSPIINDAGLLCVGGRLKNMPNSQKYPVFPIILPKKHFITILIVKHLHETVFHQGRLITEGAVRTAGYWVLGMKRLLSSLIFQCVTCKRIRGKSAVQKMADLPIDRLSPGPPFTFVGVDVFGPWQIANRRTRGGGSSTKRWAAIFTCLVSRAVHIEVIEDLSSSCFINAMRRFISIRGPVQHFRSDRGTNFVGAVKELGLEATYDETGPVHQYLVDQKCSWIFNPPHASHMGGSWERLINTSRRILDGIIFKNNCRHLTHEVLTTLMAEVSAVINSRPIVPVSYDPEDPLVLSPSILLTHKTAKSEWSFDEITIKDAYRSNWKYIQFLAENFWRKWKQEFLNNLQQRAKWLKEFPNLCVGNIVLLKQIDSSRAEWPLGLVTETFPGEDGLVRKVEIRVSVGGKPKTFIRPIKELVPLL